MVVGLVGAFLTAAYMTRCVYLTFFGEYRGHAPPARVAEGDHRPAVVLAGFSIVAGLANASAFGIEKFKEYVEPHGVAFPEVLQPDFDIALAAMSFVARDRRHRGRPRSSGSTARSSRGLKGLTERSGAAKAGHPFLVNKYYLDHLYEGIDRRRHQGPDRPRVVLGEPERDRRRRERRRSRRDRARPADVPLRRPGRRRRRGQRHRQRDRTQAGGLLRPLQSGRLQRYALILFASVGLIALAIAIFG